MRKLFREIHLWLSVPFGLIITITCLTGAVLVFETEIMEAVRHDLYYVKSDKSEAIPVNDLVNKVSAQLPDSVSVTGVTISSDPKRAYQVNLSKPRRASVMVDQYTGEIKGRNERSAFFMFNFRLHRWLLDSMKPDGGIFWGKIIVGVSTIVFIFVLLTGFVIWWPKTKKMLINRLSLACDKGWRRFWYDLHVSVGFYAFIFLLIMAITGPTWSFEWYRNGFYKVFGTEVMQPPHGAQSPQGAQGNGQGGQQNRGGQGEGRQNREGASQRGEGRQQSGEGRGQRGEGQRGEGERKAVDAYVAWNVIFNEVVSLNPDYKRVTISSDAASVSNGGWGNQRAADSYKYNSHTGKITEITKYGKTERASKLRGWIYTMHVGSWGGIFSKILAFVAALIGASLPLTGYYLWYKRSLQKKFCGK